MEIIIELLLELLLQLGAEALTELGVRKRDPRKPPSAWLALFGYLCLGGILGSLSLFVFQNHFVTSEAMRLVALIAVPLVAGCCFSLLGHWRVKQGQHLIRLDSFAYGFAFALAFGLVRFLFAR
jgi:hypothetical protein